MYFADRRDAGRQLAARLSSLRLDDPVVIGLPRGGVPVAFEVAQALGAPLDVLIVRKIGAPQNPEYGIGAVAETGTVLVNSEDLTRLGISQDDLEELIQTEQREIDRRQHYLRADHPPIDVQGRPVILVDDGLATGVTAMVAARALRGRGAQPLILAVPVGAPPTIQILASEVDRLICLSTPAEFRAVGLWYDDFSPTTDDEVARLLAKSREEESG